MLSVLVGYQIAISLLPSCLMFFVQVESAQHRAQINQTGRIKLQTNIFRSASLCDSEPFKREIESEKYTESERQMNLLISHFHRCILTVRLCDDGHIFSLKSNIEIICPALMRNMQKENCTTLNDYQNEENGK